MLQFPLDELLADIRSRYFPALKQPVGIGFIEQKSLAQIVQEPKPSFINVHILLNGPYTPVEVMSFFCKHELLHLVIPTREIDGRKIHHPPEFFAEEARIAPERALAWNWIWWNFRSCLKRCEKEEKTLVKRGWKKRLQSLWQYHNGIDLSHSKEMLLMSGHDLPPEGEFLKWL